MIQFNFYDYCSRELNQAQKHIFTVLANTLYLHRFMI